jgi:hypothetical protein
MGCMSEGVVMVKTLDSMLAVSKFMQQYSSIPS